jgi:hypothetical protein
MDEAQDQRLMLAHPVAFQSTEAERFQRIGLKIIIIII